MTTLWATFLALQMVSVGFALVTLWRLYEYIRRYRFDESKYTLLFGFVHLRWIMSFYFLAVVLWIGASSIIFTIL